MLSDKTVQLKLTPRPVRYVEQADSTNDLAMAWLREGAPDGSAVIADEQVKGRGRLGRGWYTPPRSALIVSVVLRPKAEHLHQITMLGALAICEMIEGLPHPFNVSPTNEGAKSLALGIKWPNDVQLNGRKVSGVLSEAAWEGDALRGVVLGMGVNVRIDFSGTELADSAISIEHVLGKKVERLELLAELLARVDYWYERLGEPMLFDAWRSRLNMLGQTVTVQQGQIHGVAEGVEADGSLLVRGTDGNIQRVVAGDIALGS
jgi:BirA family biotin operon repressor/biotin-[acetyl-CoA-carboxylase] ligase